MAITLSEREIKNRATGAEYENGKATFRGPAAKYKAEAFVTILTSRGESVKVTHGVECSVVTTRFHKPVGPVKAVKPVRKEDTTKLLDRARKVQAAVKIGTVRSYDVLFQAPLWTRKKGVVRGNYNHAVWDDLRTVRVKAASATEAFQKALRGNLKPVYKKYVFAHVVPAKTSHFRPDAGRDFGDFYGYRSVSDNRWVTHVGYPGYTADDNGSCDDC